MGKIESMVQLILIGFVILMLGIHFVVKCKRKIN